MTNASAIVQIAILYFVFYAILKGAKGSRFGQALMGFGILAALLIAFAYLFHFDVLTRIVQFLLIYIAVSTVVIFQPEIRRILSAVGAFGFLEKPKYGPGDAATPDLVVDHLLHLSEGLHRLFGCRLHESHSPGDGHRGHRHLAGLG